MNRKQAYSSSSSFLKYDIIIHDFLKVVKGFFQHFGNPVSIYLDLSSGKFEIDSDFLKLLLISDINFTITMPVINPTIIKITIANKTINTGSPPIPIAYTYFVNHLKIINAASPKNYVVRHQFSTFLSSQPS